jgi:hypothetical protein
MGMELAVVAAAMKTNRRASDRLAFKRAKLIVNGRGYSPSQGFHMCEY